MGRAQASDPVNIVSIVFGLNDALIDWFESIDWLVSGLIDTVENGPFKVFSSRCLRSNGGSTQVCGQEDGRKKFNLQDLSEEKIIVLALCARKGPLIWKCGRSFSQSHSTISMKMHCTGFQYCTMGLLLERHSQQRTPRVWSARRTFRALRSPKGLEMRNPVEERVDYSTQKNKENSRLWGPCLFSKKENTR